MSRSARVTSIDALKALHATLCTFQHDARDALLCVEMEVRRAFDWLEEQRRYWQAEVRHRYDEVVAVKAELNRKKTLYVGDRPPDTSELEEMLDLAERRLEEAEEKTEATRKWVPLLKRAVDDYEGPARRLAATLEGDLPRAFALLEGKITTLESYVALAPPAETAPANPSLPEPTPHPGSKP